MHETYLSAEVALRRNYQDLSFCPQDDKKELNESRRRSLKQLEDHQDRFLVYHASDEGAASARFIENGILPQAFPKLTSAALAADEKQGVYAAINVEEHLLLLARGKAEDTIELTGKVRALETEMSSEEHPFARNKQFDFLSFRPVLAGSGLYVSILLHLPMLGFLKQTLPLSQTVLEEYQCLLKPFPEGENRNPGKLFLLTNAKSQKMTDDEIQKHVLDAADLLDKREAALREKAVSKDGQSNFSDQIWRAYGTLRYARRLTSRDYLLLWSNVRLGAAAEILPLSLKEADDLLKFSQDSVFGQENPDPKTIPYRRADTVRQVLAGG